MDTEEKLELVGTELIETTERVNKLISIATELNERVEGLERNNKTTKFDGMRNELTYVHNEVNEIKKLLGMFGDVPKKKYTSKYKVYDNT